MSDHDEFEDLIKNFKLDDLDESERARQPQPARRVFNFDDDNERYESDRQSRALPTSVRERPTRRAAAGEPPPPKKSTFQVTIGEDDFRGAPDPRTRRAKKERHGDGGGQGGGGDDSGSDAGGSNAGRWIKAIIALLIVLGASVFLAIFALQSAGDMFGLNKPDGEIQVELPDGLSTTEVAKLLKKDGVITQPLTFQIYAGLKSKSGPLLPGSYTLNSNMSYDEILVMFRTGTGPEEKTLIFYEGMSLSDIATKLEKNDICKKADLFAYLNKGDFSEKYPFLGKIPASETRYRRFEGYFFPDTYNFYVGEDPAVIVQKFFNRFNQMVVSDELQEQMTKQGLTLDQAITLASIIQKEAAKTEDMKMVSSVFHHRMLNAQAYPKLQSDVTILYVEDDIKPYLDDPKNASYQPIYDAYNTYVCDGLPVGPICSPGMDAIKAAIYPKDTQYNFFIADKDGKFYYAVTPEEHQANIQAAGIEGSHGIAMPESSGK